MEEILWRNARSHRCDELWPLGLHLSAISKRWRTIKTASCQIVMDRHGSRILNAYSQLLVRTCHARGALAMGDVSLYSSKRPARNGACNRQGYRRQTERISKWTRWHMGRALLHWLILANVVIFDKHLDGKVKPNGFPKPSRSDVINADSLLKPCEGSRDEAGVCEKYTHCALLHWGFGSKATVVVPHSWLLWKMPPPQRSKSQYLAMDPTSRRHAWWRPNLYQITIPLLVLPRARHNKTWSRRLALQQVDLKRQLIFSSTFTAKEFAAFLILNIFVLVGYYKKSS